MECKGCKFCSVQTEENELKDDLCGFLREFHKGREKAILSRELEEIFGLNGRSIRRRVSALRKDGIPICSDETGYYYAGNQKEIDMTVGRLNEFLTGVAGSRTGLMFAVPDIKKGPEIIGYIMRVDDGPDGVYAVITEN